MKPSSATTPIACAQPASASVRNPKPASRQAPAARASRPGAEADSSRRDRGVLAVVELTAQHQPEQQRERREQDQRAAEHGDDHGHERVVGGGSLTHGQAREQQGVLRERPAGDHGGDRDRRGVARGLEALMPYERQRDHAGESGDGHRHERV
jgi:hypothetical protein